MLNVKKVEHHLSKRCFDDLFQFLKEMLLANNVIPNNFYHTKKLVQGLGLRVEKINCWLNGCMIYWGKGNELTSCKVCACHRYKLWRGTASKSQTYILYKKKYYFLLTPRSQRLYASNAMQKKWGGTQKISLKKELYSTILTTPHGSISTTPTHHLHKKVKI